MHDRRLIRDDLAILREGMRRRGKLDTLGPVIDRAQELDRERRTLIQAVEERKAARNALSQDVARLKKAKEDATEVMAQARALGDEIAKLEAELAQTERDVDGIMLELPNIPLADVPEGGEDDSPIIREWGTPRSGDGLLPHWDIAERLGLFDLPRATKVTGSGFAVFRGQGARLVRALINYCLDLQSREHGYEELWVPVLVNRESLVGTSQLPKFEEELYAVPGDGFFLVPTAEVPVTNLYRDEILDADALPRGFVAYTPCFRREAGAAGKDTRGIQRMHQFDKVELVRYSAPEQGEEQLELLTRHAETVLQRLGLAYRVKLLAAGDTGFGSAKTYDLEAWAPGVQRWLEVSSCSTFTDFQARRANIRYRPGAGEKPRFVHTFNGSSLGFARTVACILEVYQRSDGTVEVPAVLRPYVGAEILE